MTIDAHSSDSLKESDSVKNKITFRSSANRTSVLDLTIFQIFVAFLAFSDDHGHIIEED